MRLFALPRGIAPQRGCERFNQTSQRANMKTTLIAVLSFAAILLHLALRFAFHSSPTAHLAPLLATLALGGVLLLSELLQKLFKREFGSDLLGGISIVTSVILGEYLAGSIIVLMLSGGEALERYALRNASSVLAALAKRMPSVAHRQRAADLADVSLEEIAVGDTLVIFPHETSPADGVVIDGHGVMDESYLTGEPFRIAKTRGSLVISGAINGESALTIRTSARRRFAIRPDHERDAGIRDDATAVAPAGRSTGRHLHASGARRGSAGLGP